MQIVVKKSFFKDFMKKRIESGDQEIIEKARKGEMLGGEYMFRENIAEKVTEKNGKKIVRRYNYYYIKDMLKQSASQILDALGKFIFKGKPDELKKIEKAYTNLNIQENYDADKKTFYQHVCEYFSHRKLWDKRFENKDNREKTKKPIKMKVAEKVDVKGLEAVKHESDQLDLFDTGKPEFKPNPSLMYKVWSMYTGAELEKKEKTEELAAQKLNEETIKNIQPEEKTTVDTSKKVDWYQAFAGSWNRFYPSGTGGKPYAVINYVNNKGHTVGINKRAVSKTDISGILDGVNDFVFECEHLGEKARQNFVNRLKEIGFSAQKEYTDDKGNTKYMLMIRDGSKAGLVEMIPNSDYKIKEYTVITHDENGNETDRQVFNDINDAQAFMDKQRKSLELGETDQEKHDNRSDAMMGNQNAKKNGPEYEKYKDHLIKESETGAKYFNLMTIKSALSLDKSNCKKLEKYLASTKDTGDKFNTYYETYKKFDDRRKAFEIAKEFLVKKPEMSLKEYFTQKENEPAKPDELTSEEKDFMLKDWKKFSSNMQILTMMDAANKGEEKQYFKEQIKNIAQKSLELKNRWQQSYDENLGKHKAGFHLFDANSDWYITEWDGANEAYGYTILNGDKDMAEWGYIDLPSLQAAHKSPFNQVEIDLHYNDNYVEDNPDVGVAIEVIPMDDDISETDDLNNWKQSEKLVTREIYANSNVDELKNALKEAQNDKDNYSGLLNRFENEKENPNVLDFATPETIAENERATKANIDSMKHQIAKTDGKIETLTEMIAEKESEAEKHANRSNAMLGNDNAKKDGIIETDGGNEDGRNNNRIEQTGISNRDRDLRTERTSGSGENVLSTGPSNNENEPGIGADEPGSRPGGAETSSGIARGDGSGRLTKGQARKIREACKKLLAEKTDSEMTEADKALLSQYVGAGGTEEENASNSGVLYEFYTPRTVIDKVWQLVDKYNPNKNKTVIEPSSGIGRFAENRPEKFTLFELEEDSSRIAKILHPDAEVVQGAFQENFIKNGRFTKKNFEKFDVAVGNPPYGKYTGLYKGMGEGKGHTRYDEYFLDRTLDTVKDGGIVAFVMPSHFLESKNSKIKEKLAEKGKLLEAWRLPNGTFDTTDVGTDIVIIRKEKGNAADFSNSQYFADNPSHVVGDEATRIGRFGEEKYVKVKDGQTFESAVDGINVNAVEVDKKIEEISNNVKTEVTKKPKNTINIPTDKKYGDVIETPEGKGKVTGFVFGAGRVKKGYNVNLGNKSTVVYFNEEPKETEAEKHANRSRAMKGNKNAAGEHEFTPSTGKNMTAEEFNAKYGKKYKAEDLEIWKITDINGYVDPSKLTDKQRKYVDNNTDYLLDGDKYINVANYASGNIREKLDNLDKNDAQYELKKSLLEAVMPAPKKIGTSEKVKVLDKNGNPVVDSSGNEVYRTQTTGFTLSPISSWTEKYRTKDGSSLIDSFFSWAYNGNGYYSASNSPISAEEIPPDISFSDVKDYIEKIPVRAESRNGEDKKYNQRVAYRKREKRRETAERLFNRFLREGLSLEDQKELEKAWNDNFNTYVNPDYTKIPLFVDGMNENKGTKDFTLTKQQLKGVSQLINKGTGLLAYDVGVGKTAVGIVATVNQIQTGRAKRPLICVPKAVYKNWINSIHQHFPNIKVNELGNLSKQFIDKDFKPEDGSISVCTYEGLEKFEFNEESQKKITEDVEFGAMYEDVSDKSARAQASHSEKIMETVGGMIKTSGDTVLWDNMGFDHITVDEVHNFRNLFAQPRNIPESGKEDDVKGQANEFKSLGGGKPSERAKKLFAITQLIQRENNGRNTFLLSATPFQNSPIEIYSILSYMARDRLKEMGIYSLDQFVKQFCVLKSEYVVKANKVEEKMVMKDFNNLTALQNLITEYIDKVDGDEAGVVRPEKRTHVPELEMTDLQKAIMEKCNEYIEEQEELPKDDRDPGYMFRAMNAMRNCALSPALVGDDFIPDGYTKPKEVVESSPKLKFVCDSVIAQYKKDPHNGQLIYMPSGVEQFPEVKQYLVDHGMPKSAIALMKGAASTDKALDEREKVMNEFNDVNGECKVIIGSSTIKEGVSLNGNSTVVYNTQLDWNPTDAQQVEGRIWRQGNKQGITHIVYPIMYDSIDAMIYQKFDEKGSRINELFSYKGDNLNVEDINPEELKFGLIKDPDKRADMQVRQFKEKAEGDYKLYGQMIDVLHKQREVAFGDPVQKVKDSYANDYIERQQNQVTNYKNKLQKLDSAEDEFKRTWKGKEDSYNPSYYKSSGPYANQFEDSGFTLAYEWRAGKDGYKDALESIKRYKDSYASDIKYSMANITQYNKEIKKAENSQKAVLSYLDSKGIKTPEDLERKIQEYVGLMDEAKKNAEKSESMRAEFYKKAVEDNAQKAKTLPSLNEQIKMNVDSIMNDLHPMDEEWKAKLKERLYEQYPDLRKSLFVMYKGRLFIRK